MLLSALPSRRQTKGNEQRPLGQMLFLEWCKSLAAFLYMLHTRPSLRLRPPVLDLVALGPVVCVLPQRCYPSASLTNQEKSASGGFCDEARARPLFSSTVLVFFEAEREGQQRILLNSICQRAAQVKGLSVPTVPGICNCTEFEKCGFSDNAAEKPPVKIAVPDCFVPTIRRLMAEFLVQPKCRPRPDCGRSSCRCKVGTFSL